MKIVIVGAGEVGVHLASRLARESKDDLVIDNNPAAVKRLAESIDVQTITNSGRSPAILESAGIREAEIMLAVTDSDDASLFFFPEGHKAVRDHVHNRWRWTPRIFHCY